MTQPIIIGIIVAAVNVWFVGAGCFHIGEEAGRRENAPMMGDVELQKFTDAAWYPVMNISGRTAEDCAIEPQLWAKTVGVHLVDLGAPAVPLRLVFKPFTESRRRDEQEERLR